jgi:hypothetical protein
VPTEVFAVVARARGHAGRAVVHGSDVARWNSLESVAGWHRFFEVAGIVSLAVLVAMEIGAYFYGHRHETLATAEADRRVEAVRRQIVPRVLPENVAHQLATALRAAGVHQVRLSYPGNDPDAKSYTEQFRQVFLRAGWQVENVHNVLQHDEDPVGLILGFSAKGAVPNPKESSSTLVREEDVPPSLRVLQAALKDAGLAADVRYTADLPEGVVELRVGHKPPLAHDR